MIQLGQNILTVTKTRSGTGFATMDWKDATIKINFYVPVDAADYNIQLKGPDGQVYTISSPEHEQTFVSWNGLYKIHTFTVRSVIEFTKLIKLT